MRTYFLPLCAALALLACTEKDSRPAKEVVAQAKGAAADATQSAREAAASVKATAEDAKQSAEVATAKADRAVTDAVSTAAQATRNGAENVAQGVRELGAGGVVTGRVAAFSGARLELRPDTKGPAELRVDDRTRYLLHGGALGRAALPRGTRVKATYVVEAQVPTATEVEVLR
jgi:hypothetical protein